MVADVTPKAETFALRTAKLSVGKSDKVVARTDQLIIRLKVYAEGGENGLHAHHDEDHSFVILDGQATFHDKDDNATIVNKYEGIMIPKGTYYRFESTGTTNLVLLRVGAGRKPGGGFRLGPDGKPLTREENFDVEGVPVPGQFFGA